MVTVMFGHEYHWQAGLKMEVVSDSPVNGLGIEQVPISYNDASESTNYQQLLSYPTTAPVTVTPNAAAGRWRSISVMGSIAGLPYTASTQPTHLYRVSAGERYS